MKAPRNFDFNERLAFSNGYTRDVDNTLTFLRHRIPCFAGVRKAAELNDKRGCDYYVERTGLYSLGIDLKLRGEDFSVQGSDDLALETFSVIETEQVGWTRDASKAADYILWIWKDTGRFFLVPFPPLCAVFQKHWQEWRCRYKTAQQRTSGPRSRWHSECVYVPRQTVINHIEKWMSGKDAS